MTTTYTFKNMERFGFAVCHTLNFPKIYSLSTPQRSYSPSVSCNNDIFNLTTLIQSIFWWGHWLKIGLGNKGEGNSLVRDFDCVRWGENRSEVEAGQPATEKDPVDSFLWWYLDGLQWNKCVWRTIKIGRVIRLRLDYLFSWFYSQWVWFILDFFDLQCFAFSWFLVLHFKDRTLSIPFIAWSAFSKEDLNWTKRTIYYSGHFSSFFFFTCTLIWEGGVATSINCSSFIKIFFKYFLLVVSCGN